MAILGFAGTGGAAVRQPLLRPDVGPRHRPAERGLLDHRPGRLPRAARWPTCSGTGSSGGPRSARWSSPASASPPTAMLFVTSLYMPHLWMVVALQFLANAAVSPLAICIFLTLAATAPPEMRTICFAMFGVYVPGLRGVHRRGAPGGGERRRRLPERADGGPHPHRTGLRHRRPDAAHRVPLCEARHHPGHRGRPRALRRGAAAPGRGGRPGPAGPQPRLLLRLQPGAVRRQPRDRPGGDRGPARDQRGGEVHAAPDRGRLWSTPTGGSSASSGPPAPILEPEQIIDQDVGPAGGGEDDLPGPHRAGQPPLGAYSLRGDGSPGPDRPRRGPRPLPRAGRPPGPAGRDPVGRRAADAGPGPGDDDPAQAADDRRAGPGPGPQGRRPPDGHRPRGERPGDHGGPGGAERQPGHEPGRTGHLPRAR